MIRFRVSAAVLMAAVAPAAALPDPADSWTLPLSGAGPSDAVTWEFRCDRGRRCGSWSTIPVPSQWELHGFGSYSYGQDDDRPFETGHYRRSVTVPTTWAGRRIELVFDGAMTDTEVRIDGRVVGRPHRGGFVPFRYEITERVEPGRSFRLDVLVSERSTDPSINRAERDADYWLFGGLYRPVRLVAHPPSFVRSLRIDAGLTETDGPTGRLRTAVSTVAPPTGSEIRVEVREGERVLASFAAAATDSGPTELGGAVHGIRPWSAESPTLYVVRVTLLDAGGRPLHRLEKRIGFRNVELRRGDGFGDSGLFVNGRRVLLRGVNRHSFWPDSGRALDPATDRADVELLLELGANAVRSSHYPPNEAFLDACDELGLYVIDELPGWHDPYALHAGRPILEAMIARDQHHPSILFWANGNEGGWNTALDPLYRRLDPQRRPVLHPGSTFGGVDATHYPSWATLERSLRAPAEPAHGAGEQRLRLGRWLSALGLRPPLVLPTEFLHALYDGGGGAGLDDYWALLTGSPRALGGFLWALLDEGVVRTDDGGRIDTHGNFAPDGIVGPYREREASFDTIRAIWRAGSDGDAGNAPRDPGPIARARVRSKIRHQSGDGPAPRVDLPAPELPFGPLPSVLGSTRPASAARPAAARSTREGAALLTLPPTPDLPRLEWRRLASGPLRLSWTVRDTGSDAGAGIHLPFSDASVTSIEREGLGPHRVWANRLLGGTFGSWRGAPQDAGFAGYYAGTERLLVETTRGSFTVLVESPGLFVGYGRAEFPDDARHARAPMPATDGLTFAHRIPAIGTKFHPPTDLAPPRRTPSGLRQGVVWFVSGPDHVSVSSSNGGSTGGLPARAARRQPQRTVYLTNVE